MKSRIPKKSFFGTPAMNSKSGITGKEDHRYKAEVVRTVRRGWQKALRVRARKDVTGTYRYLERDQ